MKIALRAHTFLSRLDLSNPRKKITAGTNPNIRKNEPVRQTPAKNTHSRCTSGPLVSRLPRDAQCGQSLGAKASSPHVEDLSFPLADIAMGLTLGVNLSTESSLWIGSTPSGGIVGSCKTPIDASKAGETAWAGLHGPRGAAQHVAVLQFCLSANTIGWSSASRLDSARSSSRFVRICFTHLKTSACGEKPSPLGTYGKTKQLSRDKG